MKKILIAAAALFAFSANAALIDPVVGVASDLKYGNQAYIDDGAYEGFWQESKVYGKNTADIFGFGTLSSDLALIQTGDFTSDDSHKVSWGAGFDTAAYGFDFGVGYSGENGDLGVNEDFTHTFTGYVGRDFGSIVSARASVEKDARTAGDDFNAGVTVSVNYEQALLR